jgi:hypothetical protein
MERLKELIFSVRAGRTKTEARGSPNNSNSRRKHENRSKIEQGAMRRPESRKMQRSRRLSSFAMRICLQIL